MTDLNNYLDTRLADAQRYMDEYGEVDYRKSPTVSEKVRRRRTIAKQLEFDFEL